MILIVETRATHHVHKGIESLPCYCTGTSDHLIGQENNTVSDEDLAMLAALFRSRTFENSTNG